MYIVQQIDAGCTKPPASADLVSSSVVGIRRQRHQPVAFGCRGVLTGTPPARQPRRGSPPHSPPAKQREEDGVQVCCGPARQRPTIMAALHIGLHSPPPRPPTASPRDSDAPPRPRIPAGADGWACRLRRRRLLGARRVPASRGQSHTRRWIGSRAAPPAAPPSVSLIVAGSLRPPACFALASLRFKWQRRCGLSGRELDAPSPSHVGACRGGGRGGLPRGAQLRARSLLCLRGR
jgi:hypothetical protein